MAGTIDIGTVLNKLNDTVDEKTQDVKVFGIRFINSKGDTREMIVRKNVKNPQQKQLVRAPRGKEQFHLQRNGVMLVNAEGEDHPRTIKTAMIYGFRDYKESYWLNVFH